jgi:hypothetical protein
MALNGYGVLISCLRDDEDGHQLGSSELAVLCQQGQILRGHLLGASGVHGA